MLAAITSGVLYKHRGRPYAHGKSASIESVRSFRLAYLYLRLSTLLVGVSAFVFDHLALLEAYRSLYAALAGIAISVLGLAVFIWSKMALGPQYSPCFDAMLPTQVVTLGPYRWVRHPIYTANVLLVVGIAIGTGSMWLYLNAVILAAYYIYTVPIEERALAGELKEYRSYVGQSRRFIPGVW